MYTCQMSVGEMGDGVVTTLVPRLVPLQDGCSSGGRAVVNRQGWWFCSVCQISLGKILTCIHWSVNVRWKVLVRMGN